MLRTNLVICLKKRINHKLDVEISPSQTAYRRRRETTKNVFATKIFTEKTISSIIWSYVMHFSASSPKLFSLKKFLKNTCSEKVSYIFSKKSFSNLQEMELSYIFFKNVFLIFCEGYIQNPRHILNPGIFKSQDIFRTLPKIYIQRFAKNSYLTHFLNKAQNI